MSTVITRLNGGLGNQMFQYAAGRALALRHRARLKLDVTSFETDGLRRYELGAYPVEADLATPGEMAAFRVPFLPIPTWWRALRRLGLAQARYYREPHFHYDAGLAGVRPSIVIDGYWQCERYFADAADALRRELTPRGPPEPENAAVAAEIGQVTAVSLHVRRGDYVSDSRTNAYHGVCSLDYYRAAIEHVRARVPEPHLFVFSDDHDWTRDNLALDLPTTHVTANGGDRGSRDIQLMALCRHHVIANSSFSWWGAWLNPSPDKVVVAPARWFGTADLDTRDLVPASWVRL